MPYRIAARREIGQSLVLSVSLGLTLAFGLLPFCDRLAGLLPGLSGHVVFVIVSLLFFITVRRAIPRPNVMVSRQSLWLRAPLPFAIALLFGLFQPGSWRNLSAEDLLWVTVLGPVGEEFLFRGWVFGLFERMFPRTYLTMTNALPIPVWMSSIAFSLWHLQSPFSISFLAFQMIYTFFVGIWLSVWRWQGGSMGPPIVAHCCLNVFSLAF